MKILIHMLRSCVSLVCWRNSQAAALLLLSVCSVQAQQVFTPQVKKAVPVLRVPAKPKPHLIPDLPWPPPVEGFPGLKTAWTYYEGKQSPDWPREAAPKVEMRFAIPVFIGSFPNRPYSILGHVYVAYPAVQFANQHEEALRCAAWNAKKHGADAFMLRPAGPVAKDWYAAGTAIKWGAQTKREAQIESDWKRTAENLRTKARVEATK